MHNMIKAILYIVCGLVLFITIGAASLLLLFNPNHYKSHISDKFLSMTGYVLTIKGDISWSFFPSLSLQMNDIVVDNSPSYSEKQPLATLSNASLSIKLMPLLLDRHLETRNITLNNLTLNITQNSKDDQHIKKLIQAFQTNKTNKISAVKKQENKITKSDDFKITIHHIDLKNGQIYWHDTTTQKEGSVLIHSLESSDVNFDEHPFPFSLDMQIHDPNRDSTAKIKFSSNLQLDKECNLIKFSLAKAAIQLTGIAIPHQIMNIHVNANITYNANTTQLTASDLTGGLNNLTFRGNVHGNIHPFNLQGKLITNYFDTIKWLQSLGFEAKIPDPSIMRNTQFHIEFLTNENTTKFSNIVLNLNNASHLNGNTNIEPSNQKVLTNIHIDTLNLNQFLPLVLNKITGQNLVSMRQTQKTGVSKFSHVKTFSTIKQVEAIFNIKQVLFQTLKVANLICKTSLHNQHLLFKISHADFYNGKMTGENSVYFNTAPIQIHMNNFLENIQLQPLLVDLLNVNLLKGTATVSLKLDGKGSRWHELSSTLSGDVSATIRDGELDILDAIYLLDSVAARIGNQPIPTAPQKPITKFQEFNADFSIRHGVATSKRLMITSASLRAEGNGQVDLAQKHISIRLNVQYIGKQAKILDIQDKAGGSIPITIKGNFNNIQAEVDYALLLRQIAAIKIAKALKKASGKIGGEWDQQLDSVGQKLHQFLQQSI